MQHYSRHLLPVFHMMDLLELVVRVRGLTIIRVFIMHDHCLIDKHD